MCDRGGIGDFEGEVIKDEAVDARFETVVAAGLCAGVDMWGKTGKMMGSTGREPAVSR
jgi:hypothetical protein